MNFKTTLVLLVLLAVVGAAVMFTKDKPADTSTTETPTGKKLLSINGGDVQTLTITPAGGKKIVAVRQGLGWKFTEPVNAPADAGVLNAMVADIVGLESQSSVAVSDGSGLKSPRFVVDLFTTDGKTTTVSFGDRSSVGDRLYVQLKGNTKADLVAAGVDEQLDKPLDDLRDKKLVSLTSDQVKYISIERPDGKLELVKDGGEWKITQPMDVAADDGAVSDLLFAVTGLKAVEFVQGSPSTPTYGLGPDAKKVTLATAAPSTTQPTTQPTSVTLAFGRPDSVLQQNVFATVAGSNAVVKIARTSTSFLDRKPLELRDKQVADIDPASVNILSVVVNSPATTQPTTKPAESKQYVVKRRPPPATQPGTTQPATDPTLSTWTTTAGEPAGDPAVTAILTALHPLKAQRFVETAPIDGKTISVKLETGGGGVRVAGQTEIRFIDPGETGQPVGTYNGLSFEVERSLLDKLQTDFTKPGALPTVDPEAPPMGPMMP